MSGLISAFLIWPGVPLFVALATLSRPFRGKEEGGGPGGLAIAALVIGSCSLITWMAIVTLSMYYGWWIFGSSIGLSLLTEVILGSALE